MGSFVVADAETNIDPNAHIMSKAHSRVFILNGESLLTMMEELGYSYEQALCYVEAVSQLPEHKKGSIAYTGHAHPIATIDPGEVDILNAYWFDNSWTGNSWTSNLAMVDGGVPCFWTKNEEDKDDPFTAAHRKYDAKFPNRGWKVGYDKHPTFDDVCNELKKFLMTYPTEEKHIWIQGELEGMSTTETIRRLKSECVIAFTKARSSSAATSPTIMTYWHTPILASQDLAYSFGGRTPQRIPIIPWRPTNFGVRIMAPGLKPQLFPSSTLKRDMGVKFSTMEMNGTISAPAIYTNYSGFVKLIPLRRELKLDYGWLPMGNNEYAMADPNEVTEPLFMVEDDAFFMGLGSVVTGCHGVYGLGRSEAELWEQLQRKLKTGHDTSGHMIAAPLAFKSQMLWYLQEVMINMTRKRSIYNLPFKEPTGGLYHTKIEYVHALNDMNKLDRARVYPFYARQNVSICADFIRAMA